MEYYHTSVQETSRAHIRSFVNRTRSACSGHLSQDLLLRGLCRAPVNVSLLHEKKCVWAAVFAGYVSHFAALLSYHAKALASTTTSSCMSHTKFRHKPPIGTDLSDEPLVDDQDFSGPLGSCKLFLSAITI